MSFVCKPVQIRVTRVIVPVILEFGASGFEALLFDVASHCSKFGGLGILRIHASREPFLQDEDGSQVCAMLVAVSHNISWCRLLDSRGLFDQRLLLMRIAIILMNGGLGFVHKFLHCVSGLDCIECTLVELGAVYLGVVGEMCCVSGKTRIYLPKEQRQHIMQQCGNSQALVTQEAGAFIPDPSSDRGGCGVD